MEFLAKYLIRVTDMGRLGEAYHTREEKVFNAGDRKEATKMADEYGRGTLRSKLTGVSIMLESLVEVGEKVLSKE